MKSTTQFRVHQAVIGVLLTFLATAIFVAFRLFIDLNADSRAAIDAMVAGSAHKPFVYRALLPFLIKGLASVIPLSIETWSQILMYGSLLGFVGAFRYFLHALYESSRFVDLASFCALIGLPLLFMQGKFYDFTTLFLFTLGLAFLANNEWRSYLILFALASFNKESTALLMLFFIIQYHDKLVRLTFIRWLFFQLVIYGAIRFFLLWYFRDNPGQALEFHLKMHWLALVYHPFLTGTFIGITLIAAFLVVYQWGGKPRFLRRAVLGTLPLLYVSYLVWGYPFEIRIFYEVYAILITMVVDSLSRFFRLNVTSLELRSPPA